MKALIEKLKIYGVKTFFSYLVTEAFYRLWTNFFLGSYSQHGEDRFIESRLNKNHGFYVDVGANDPDRFNNTKLFYEHGWRGINIEPDEDVFKRLVGRRVRDINVNRGIGTENKTLRFHQFVPDTLSTFSEQEADKYVAQGFRLLGTKEISVERLDVLLDQYLPVDTKIDFMSIDTEGFDMQVLESNNWSKYRPRLICIESVAHTFDGKDNLKEDDHVGFLKSIGYEKVFDNGLNSIYEDRNEL